MAGKREHFHIPVQSLGVFVLERLKKYGDNAALVDAATGESKTFLDIINRTRRLAAGLQNILGVREGEVVAIVAPNHLDYFVTYYAVALVGATFQTINPLYTKDDIAYVLKECDTSYVITVPVLLPKVREALAEFPDIKTVLHGEDNGCISFSSLLLEDYSDFVPSNCDPKTSVVALLSSSGTTGFPKAVKLSHYCLVANMLQLASSGFPIPGDTLILFLPMFHMYGLSALGATAQINGAKIIVMPKFSAEEYLSLIEKHQATILHTVPPVMVMFAKHPKVKDLDKSFVKRLVCGAAPLSEEIEEKVKKIFNLGMIHQGYGMTESGVTHLNRDGKGKFKSSGQRLPLVEIKIVDVESGAPLGPNEDGEILVRGPQVSLGYHNHPAQNQEMFAEDGWVHTGDIGHEDEEQYIYIVDRLKELIKYNAYQVAPAVLEDILLRHDAVADVGVIGVPDIEAGELPKAFVVKKPEKDATEQELIDFVAGCVAPHMKLRGGIEFVSEIPRSASGKILRRILREKTKKI